jgi:Asp-tRNA(Asn)/Glu-tRNA(Gln) amidotransferase A subunit family amidase
LDEDAFVYTQLKNAGAVLCAKLSLGALAMITNGLAAIQKIHGTCKQGSSGSSAGSAASVAAGLLPFTIGTETLGSIVSPSHRCGATGLRPTFGTVSRSGAMVLCWSLDKAGPICRSAEDDAIVYSYIKGTDGKDPGAVNHAFNYHQKNDVTKIKVGLCRQFIQHHSKDAVQWKVIEEFRAMGIDPVKAVDFPDTAVYKPTW